MGVWDVEGRKEVEQAFKSEDMEHTVSHTQLVSPDHVT